MKFCMKEQKMSSRDAGKLLDKFYHCHFEDDCPYLELCFETCKYYYYTKIDETIKVAAEVLLGRTHDR